MEKVILLLLASIVAITLITGCTNLQSYMEQSNAQHNQLKLG